MFLQDPDLASYSAYTVLVRLRLGLSPPRWHRKDMSRLVDGRKELASMSNVPLISMAAPGVQNLRKSPSATIK